MKKQSKPLLVMLHGFRGSGEGLGLLARELDADFEILRPDLPGSGSSAELERQNLEGFVEWLHEYITALPKKPVLAMHSMGAIVGSHYLEKYPKDVQSRVILMSPIICNVGGKILNRALYGIATVGLAPFSERYKLKIWASPKISGMISWFLVRDRSRREFVFAENQRCSGKTASTRSLFADMKLATRTETTLAFEKKMLVIVGRGDRLASRRLVRERANLAGAKYEELVGAGHLINYERPEEVAKLIREFLC